MRPYKFSELNRRHLLLGAAATIAMPMILTRSAFAVTPDELKKRGKIIVGIQGDNPPWGFVNSTGKQEGFDADVAALYAKELGVNLEFMPLDVANLIVLVAPKTTVVKTNEDMGKLKAISVPRASAQDTQVTKFAPAGTNIL